MSSMITLVHPSSVQYDDVYSPEFVPNCFQALMGMKYRPKKKLPLAGRMTITNAVIDFGPFLLVTLGHKMNRGIVFDNMLYSGILPLKHIEGGSYECSVDHINPVEIGNVQ